MKMVRRDMRILAVAVSLVGVSCADNPVSNVSPTDSAAAANELQPIEGLWYGSWGGGERADGVVFQPVIAELFIEGDRAELAGFRNVPRLAGLVRFDASARQMRITPAAEAGGQSTPQTVDYTFQIDGDNLTLTDSDKRSVELQKSHVEQNPFANSQMELVATNGIDDKGNLLVTEYSQLRVGRAGATYFQPRNRLLNTVGATIVLVQEAGLRKISIDEARGLVSKSVPVGITFRRDEAPKEQWNELWKEIGPPAPDSDAVSRTFAKILRPGTLVFILSARLNTAVP
jgi:hypothetical protein